MRLYRELGANSGPSLATKVAEYAPGIPSKDVSHSMPKSKKVRTWEFAVQEHDAKRRKLHYDLRLGDPNTGYAHSWAMKPEWPKPGQYVWAIQQPTHTVKYMDFSGVIPEGYGAGKVSLKERDKVEVVRSTPHHITFYRYTGRGPEEYTLHRIHGKAWKLYNKTPTRETLEIPDSKRKYKQIPINKIDLSKNDELMSAKIDGAHVVLSIPRKGITRVFSYRKAKKNPTGLIEHTQKIKGLEKGVRPLGVKGSIVRAEAYARDAKTNRPLPAETIGGMLNSNVWKSREAQKEKGRLRLALHDIDVYKGKDVSDLPYEEKLELLKQIKDALPKGVAELPQYAISPRAKANLLKKIVSGEHPQTEEGIVLWPLKKSPPPTKAKITKEHDVYIRKIFPGEGKYKGRGAGGFLYSHTPNGPIVGRVGTGLSDELREDMHRNPDKYLGRVAVVKSMTKTDEGKALRAPAFMRWHLDKNPQDVLDELVKKACHPYVKRLIRAISKSRR